MTEILDEKSQVTYGDIRIIYKPSLDGGGRTFGQEFLPVVRDKFDRLEHIFEFCAGPGFIGFSLLAHELCDRLTLADINPAAVTVCRDTVADNQLQDRVQVYQSDALADIPLTEQWDLVVSNPPHWPEYDDVHGMDIRRFDIDLQIHQRFYRDIGKYLKPDGSILLQENGQATRVENFQDMIERNGLRIVEVFQADPESRFYFIWMKKA